MNIYNPRLQDVILALYHLDANPELKDEKLFIFMDQVEDYNIYPILGMYDCIKAYKDREIHIMLSGIIERSQLFLMSAVPVECRYISPGSIIFLSGLRQFCYGNSTEITVASDEFRRVHGIVYGGLSELFDEDELLTEWLKNEKMMDAEEVAMETFHNHDHPYPSGIRLSNEKLFSEHEPEYQFLMITDSIEPYMAADYRKQVDMLVEEHPDAKIVHFFCSPGGSVSSMLSILDAFERIKHRSEAFILGAAMSAAGLWFVNFEKGTRHMSPSSTLMLHMPSSFGEITGGSEEPASVELNKYLRLYQEDSLSKLTGLSTGAVREMLSADLYMTRSEAIAKDLAD